MYRKLVEDKNFCDSEGAINNHANKGAILCIILIKNIKSKIPIDNALKKPPATAI